MTPLAVFLRKAKLVGPRSWFQKNIVCFTLTCENDSSSTHISE